MESLRQSSIRICTLAFIGEKKEGRGGNNNVNALTSSLGCMKLNSLTLFDNGTLSGRFCLRGERSAKGGGIDIVEGEKRGLEAKEGIA